MQNGGFDDVPVDRVKEFQAKFEEFLETRKSSYLDKLRNAKELKEDIVAELKTALADFKASWK